MATHAFRIMLAAVAAMALTGCKQDAATAEQSTAPTPPDPTPLSEFYSVGNADDGDDIVFNVRMHGFDTPESGKRCGDVNVRNAARDALDAIINDRSGSRLVHRRIDCVVIGHDTADQRLVAQCSVDGKDIGDQMVEQGWARDWPRYSDGRYADEEREAREARRGIWGLCTPEDNVWRSEDHYAPVRAQE